uniref:Putative secreted protein n=1 Tax=Anopheles darlingi TaxID=43151 RepID=A0A2M4DCU4_ANODA
MRWKIIVAGASVVVVGGQEQPGAASIRTATICTVLWWYHTGRCTSVSGRCSSCRGQRQKLRVAGTTTRWWWAGRFAEHRVL